MASKGETSIKRMIRRRQLRAMVLSLMHLRAHDLREEHPAPPTDANLRSEAHHQQSR
jgi:hypothetical protein